MPKGKLKAIEQLCTFAGMIMEDACVGAISVAGTDEAGRRARLAELGSAAEDICALIAAAKVLERRSFD